MSWKIGKHSLVCRRCWKPLRETPSQELGIGPICLSKYLFEEGYSIDDEEREAILKIFPNFLEKLEKANV